MMSLFSGYRGFVDPSFLGRLSAKDKPNIVPMNLGNFGWGELGFNDGV